MTTHPFRKAALRLDSTTAVFQKMMAILMKTALVFKFGSEFSVIGPFTVNHSFCIGVLLLDPLKFSC